MLRSLQIGRPLACSLCIGPIQGWVAPSTISRWNIILHQTSNLNRFMSSNKKSKSKGQVNKAEAEASPISISAQGCIRIAVEVRPNAKQSSVAGFSEDAVMLRIAAPPRDGEANEEVLRFLAQDVLGIRPKMLSLERGGKSREKLVQLDPETTGLSKEQVLQKIQQAIREHD